MGWRKLGDYLNENNSYPGGDRIHSKFIKLISRRLEDIGINEPYECFFEVPLFNLKEPEREGFRSSDIVVLNSRLYVIEGKVIRAEDHLKRETKAVKSLNSQLTNAYSYFKRNFNITPVLIGAYTRKSSKHFYYYALPPGGARLENLEILQVSCQ